MTDSQGAKVVPPRTEARQAADWLAWSTPAAFDSFRRYLAGQRRVDETAASQHEQIHGNDPYKVGGALQLSEELTARYIARFCGLPFVDRIRSEELVSGILTPAYCRANQVVTLTGRRVALANPFDWALMEVLERTLARGGPSELLLAEPSVIQSLLSDSDEDIIRPDKIESFVLTLPDNSKEEQEAGEEGEGAAIGNEIIRDAVRARASDIHFEPKDRGTLIRYRVDGDMRDIRMVDNRTGLRVISRLKAVAGMDIAERRKPQDGALETTLGQQVFKLRLASSGTEYGETLILRILEPTREPVPLGSLGFSHSQAEQLLGLAAQTQGMILVVGPTGCGKSTTIYTLLSSVDGESRSIMSVEDPIEYRIPYANQQQVRQKAGVGFESLLRSAMRQDPDILFLGEVRDRFSAQALMDFASSGHLTISTLHSANATAAILRLERLGIERAAMVDSVAGIVAQKLLKKLCVECRQSRPITQQERQLLAPYTARIPEEVAQPVGCPACRETGFHGREAVCEVVVFDLEVAELIRGGHSVAGIRAFCARRGDYLMGHHALDKVRAGILTVEQVHELILAEELKYCQPEGSTSASDSGVSASESGVSASAGAREIETADSVAGTAGSPAARDAPSSGAVPARGQGGETTAAPVILFVDDDPDLRDLIQLYLGNAGCQVLLAHDGVEALMQLAQHRVDVLLSDIQMPNMDGVELMKMINEKGVDVPVVFLTGSGDQDLEAKVLACGAVDYIRKPVRKDVLLLRLKKALRASGSHLSLPGS